MSLADNKRAKFFSRGRKGPLRGVKVIELGGLAAGPVATAELAQLGASVTKAETRNGDEARKILKLKSHLTFFNADKTSVVLEGEDREGLLRGDFIVADDDTEQDGQDQQDDQEPIVIVDNRAMRTKEEDEILQKVLKDPNRKRPIIYCSIVAYNSGSHKHESGTDNNVQARSGMMYTNASTPTKPLPVGFTVLDFVTGIIAASEIKTQLYRLKSGKFPIPPEHNNVIHLEVSMLRVSAFLQAGTFLTCAEIGKETIRNGYEDLYLAPFSLFQAKDGLVSVAIAKDTQFAIFYKKVLGNAEVPDKYLTNQRRMENRDALTKELNAALSKHSVAYWIQLAVTYQLPISKVNTATEAIKEFRDDVLTKASDGTHMIAKASRVLGDRDLPLHSAPKHGADTERMIDAINWYKHANPEVDKLTKKASIAPVLGPTMWSQKKADKPVADISNPAKTEDVPQITLKASM